MTSLSRWIVLRAVRRLPAEHRDRYRGELLAELHFLSGWSRLGYALRILVLTSALRAALDGGVPALAEATPAWPHHRPWCWAMLHHQWRTVSVEDGSSRYLKCRACGRECNAPVRTNPLPLTPPPYGYR
jgi:hypothetical protein